MTQTRFWIPMLKSNRIWVKVSWRAILVLALAIATMPAFGQKAARLLDTGAYELPFESTGNALRLSIVNATRKIETSVRVVVVKSPPWLQISPGEVNLEHVLMGDTVLAHFDISVDESALLGRTSPIEFELYSETEGLTKKIINVSVGLPTEMVLRGNYPNPFNPSTNILYVLPVDGRVRIELFDTLGRLVSVIVDQIQTADRQEVTRDGRNYPSGLYFYTIELRSDGREQVGIGKMLLVK